LLVVVILISKAGKLICELIYFRFLLTLEIDRWLRLFETMGTGSGDLHKYNGSCSSKTGETSYRYRDSMEINLAKIETVSALQQ